MQLFSTKRESPEVGFEEAIFRGLPPDNGLYMPKQIPVLGNDFWEGADRLSFQEIAFEMANALLSEEIPAADLKSIVDQAVNFPAPLVKVEENVYCLELFHGTSMAFKDFGARFMAAVMSYFLQKSNRKINILVATSGDTGGAVAQGFFGVPNITVTILYPKGKVSDIQEKQLTTLGNNVRALEIDGTFDDCQALVKQAFLDEELRSKFNLASANSINIARLIPQSFYYAQAYASLKKQGLPVVFSVPSGNFGNLCAGILAWKMGMPVKKFIAATNLNKVVPEYLTTGEYRPISPSVSTISNAMDVGNPSNFPRMYELFDRNIDVMRAHVFSTYYDDEQTKASIKDLYDNHRYLACPHTAIAYRGLKEYQKTAGEEFSGVFLSTAHYAKFLPEMEAVLQMKPDIPERLQGLLSKTKVAESLSTEYQEFKTYLSDHLT